MWDLIVLVDHCLSFCFEVLGVTNTVNFNGSNTDGSFTTAGSNSFLGPLEQIP